MGLTSPPKKNFFLKIRFFERPLEKTHFLGKKISGVGASLTPKFGDLLIFGLFVI